MTQKPFKVDPPRRQDKNEIIRKMNDKLASGKNIVAASRRKNLWRKCVPWIVWSCGAVCILIALVWVGLQWGKQTNSHSRSETAFVFPVQLIEKDFHADAFPVDTFAVYLIKSLLYYDELPVTYRQGIPCISSKETKEKIRAIWDDISLSVQNRLSREIPDIRYDSPNL